MITPTRSPTADEPHMRHENPGRIYVAIAVRTRNIKVVVYVDELSALVGFPFFPILADMMPRTEERRPRTE